MTRTRKLTAAVCLLVVAAGAGAQNDNMDKNRLSKYLGVIHCVDSVFFDGGYESGGKAREALMNAFLGRHQLPRYDEKLYAQEESIDKDIPSYTEGYMTCDEDTDALVEMADKFGIAVPDY